MKTRKIFLLLITLMAFTVNSRAQVSVNVNLGKPPVWAPAAPVETKYYYIPDIETYYDVQAQRYIYLRNGKWHRSAALPAHYRGYDLYKGKTVFLTDYRGNRPYAYYKTHKVKYKGNSNWKNKSYYKSSPGNGNGKYKGHPGKGKGNGKGNGNGKK